MQCRQCDGSGNYIERRDTYYLPYDPPYVPQREGIIIEGVLWYQCDKCGDVLYPQEMSEAIEAKRNEFLASPTLSAPVRRE